MMLLETNLWGGNGSHHCMPWSDFIPYKVYEVTENMNERLCLNALQWISNVKANFYHCE